MGRIKVRFFASFKEKTGVDEISLDISGSTTLAWVIEQLSRSTKGAKEIFNSGAAIVAVNHEVAKPELIVKDGDEVAIFPPVSGG